MWYGEFRYKEHWALISGTTRLKRKIQQTAVLFPDSEKNSSCKKAPV